MLRVWIWMWMLKVLVMVYSIFTLCVLKLDVRSVLSDCWFSIFEYLGRY